MIIKTGRSCKSNRISTLQKLIDYVFDTKKMNDPILNRKQVIAKRFIKGLDKDAWAEQFMLNDENRNYNRKGRVVLRHEYISFSAKDNKELTEEVLLAFAQEFLKTRSPKSMGVATVHYDNQDRNPHLHFLLSGVGLDKNPTRISHQEYRTFKLEFQQFQIDNFPQLKHSIVDHSKKKVKVKNLE